VATLTEVSLTLHLSGLCGGEVMVLGPPGRFASSACSLCFILANLARAESLSSLARAEEDLGDDREPNAGALDELNQN
jgi:hypothetical protein